MPPKVICGAVWLVVLVLVCGSVWGSSGCRKKAACTSCLQTSDCMWCGRSGNLMGKGGKSLSRCIGSTHKRASEWREACGAADVHEQPQDHLMSEECNFHGTYQCGECVCDEGYVGEQCECDINITSDSSCRETSASAVCSGHGSCDCGACRCHQRENPNEVVSGLYCECTNFLCYRHNGLLCGGPDHGQCVCNTCHCRPGWTGDDCTCEEGNDNCINPETGDVCSGNGKCECNQCKCYEGEEGRYSGKYCEDCPLCSMRSKCEAYKQCVQCQAFGTGPLSEEECVHKCSTIFNVTMVQRIADVWDYRLCSFFDEDDCRFQFAYGYDEDVQLVVTVLQQLQCPPPTEHTNGQPSNIQNSVQKDFFIIVLVAFLLIMTFLASV